MCGVELSYVSLMMLLLCRYRDEATIASRLGEDDRTIGECVEGMILAHAYILTRVVLCTSLTYDDVTSLAGFASKDLNA